MLKQFQNFCASTRGNVAITFGMAALPLLIAVGVAVDYGRAEYAKRQLSAALDAAVLAAGSGTELTNAERKALGKAFFDANTQRLNGDIEIDGELIKLNNLESNAGAKVHVKTRFMQLAGIPAHKDLGHVVTAKANSTATRAAVSKFEIALVLDYSGSMTNTLSGVARYEIMADAAKNLIDTLSAGGEISIAHFSLIPFHSGVNAHLKQDHLLDASGSGLSGEDRIWACIGDRASSLNITDSEPTAAAETRWRIDDLYGIGGGAICEDSLKMTALGNTYTAMKTQLDNWKPSDDHDAKWTDLSAGFAMGWHSISDNSVFEGGADYSRIKASSASQRVIKAIVLLSDGLQSMWGWRHKDTGGTGSFWYARGEYERSTNNAENNLADLCTNAKAKGVLVFTLGFALDDTDTLTLLEDCASPHPHSSEKTFYDARSANELDAAFDDIGSLLIGELYLSQ